MSTDRQSRAMYHPALAKLKKELAARREDVRNRYAKALEQREYLISVGAERELDYLIGQLDAQLKQPESQDDE